MWYALHKIIMSEVNMRTAFVNAVTGIWDWPLKSEYAKTPDERRQLKLTCEFSAMSGSLVSTAAIAFFASNAAAAILMAGVAVVGGYYAGSMAWKTTRAFRH